MNIKDLEEFEESGLGCCYGDYCLAGHEVKLRSWIIQDRINTIKQVLEMLPLETSFDIHPIPEDNNPITVNAATWNVCVKRIKSKLNKLIE